ncbi:unnamed protein product [Phytophthora fragariaefolia]|uniref:Unnamed protein product n=1 Tax=Phytophthora fragariaefolia TaxID=1490495 RepID=A0A9W6XQN4_9STRA|nr:unnamed protein product [Phytophthora fragariaefolia]
MSRLRTWLHHANGKRHKHTVDFIKCFCHMDLALESQEAQSYTTMDGISTSTRLQQGSVNSGFERYDRATNSNRAAGVSLCSRVGEELVDWCCLSVRPDTRSTTSCTGRYEADQACSSTHSNQSHRQRAKVEQLLATLMTPDDFYDRCE